MRGAGVYKAACARSSIRKGREEIQLMIKTRRIDQNMKWHPAGATRRLDLRVRVAVMFGGKLDQISAIVESRFNRQ